MVEKKNNIEYGLFKVKDVQKTAIDYKDIEINSIKNNQRCNGIVRNTNTINKQINAISFKVERANNRKLKRLAKRNRNAKK
tara:strand:+ start:86 stop:328 length:243 start_codon:yes stop_codon:yes gene_type:complete